MGSKQAGYKAWVFFFKKNPKLITFRRPEPPKKSIAQRLALHHKSAGSKKSPNLRQLLLQLSL